MSIRDLMSMGLTPQDLKFIYRKYKNIDLPVIMYNDIIKSNSIDELFNKNKSNCLVIYYPLDSDGSFGHYTSIIRHPNKIYYYDPYSFKPDHIKKFSYKYRNQLYNEPNNTLIKLLLNSNYNIDFSHYKHQKSSPKIATCGRWSILRCLRDDLTNDKFNELVKKLKKSTKSKSNDETITKIIN